MSDTWFRVFLEERPVLMLGLFRVAVAVTVGCHVVPSLLQMQDNYLSTAFKEVNGSFFPAWALAGVSSSPDWLVWLLAGIFLASWAAFLVGWRTQVSCLVMTGCCYFFYALNSLHIGTLSFDILLVTLSLMWVTGYPGDAFSLDAVLQEDPRWYARRRPFFIQRLLQLQIVWTFFYTALSKVTAGGNWLTDNPYYYLMRYPAEGVVRAFPLRSWLAGQPEVCYAIGLGVLAAEFALPALLFIPRTRWIGLGYGLLFHVLLLATLHVPTIFFFLFPAQLLLFLEPEPLVEWIERRRAQAAARPRPVLLYDGGCGFCLASVRRLAALDVFGAIDQRDFHGVADLTALHPQLTPERCRSRMQLIEPSGRLSEGFLAFRRMALALPLLWPLVPACYLPGAGWVGQRVYDWIAARRYLFHASRACQTNQCGVTPAGTGASS